MNKKLIITVSALAIIITLISIFYKSRNFFNLDTTKIKVISIKVPEISQSSQVKNITNPSSIKELIKKLNSINYKTTSQEYTETTKGAKFIVTFVEKKEYKLSFSGDIVNINGKCYSLSKKDIQDVAMSIVILVSKDK